MTIADINNPNQNGSCNNFDPNHLKDVLQTATNLTVVITAVSGTNLCELSPCSPSPCHNGGTCTMNNQVEGNYECSSCRQGYAGVNCTEDVNECDQGSQIMCTK